jgi:4-aminobutyrate aminotransferase
MSHPRIVVSPPGPRAREVIRLDSQHSSPSTSHPYPFVFDSALDCIVKDVDGNEFIDFDSGGGVANVGHNHRKVLAAVRDQLDKAIYHHGYGNAFNELFPRLSEALNTIMPGRDRRFFYSSSESEAFEAGMKVAAWHTRGHTFLGFLGSNHGTTLGALSLSGQIPEQRRHFPSLARVVSSPYPYCYRCAHREEPGDCNCFCLDVLESHLARDTPREEVAALTLEPIQANGCIVPPDSFYTRLRRLTKEHELLLLADEAFTGVGRTGRWLGLDNWEISPDIICVSGSLSSGIPLGVTGARSQVMDWDPGSHASTLGGNPLACAAALAGLDVIREEHLLENAVKQGRYMLRRLQELTDKYQFLGDARGKGLLIGLEVVKSQETREPDVEAAREMALKCWKRGLLLRRVGASTIRFCPPLTISQDLVDAGMEVLEATIHEAADT